MRKWIIFFAFYSVSLAQLPIIKIISPMEEDPIIAYKEINILGEALHTDKLYVNNYKVEMQDGLFRLKFKFSEPGFRMLNFVAENEKDKTEKKVKVVSLETFPDIKGYEYQREIEILTTMQFFPGYYGTDFFRPRYYVRRAEMARLLLMLKDINPVTNYNNTYHFQDLLPAHWAYSYIQLALNYNLMYPVNASEFAPNRIVTREEVLEMLKKFYKYAGEETHTFYSDLLTDNSEHRWFSFLAASGYLPPAWVAEDNFNLNKPVTRGELVYLTARIDKIYARIKKDYQIELPLVKKMHLTQNQENSSEIIIKNLTGNVFVIECNPDKLKKTLFVEFQLKQEKGRNTVLLVDDGEGADILQGDGIFTGIINLGENPVRQYKYLYKLFDEYNLIYKVGEGSLVYENGKTGIN
ncbi:MAG: S-layer homology domain-containing protein [Candidatus Margulisbacteria bacterium]|nr:S-layer homology domain-containing protein [Candidatus Margulisiibacteriota bacterium]